MCFLHCARHGLRVDANGREAHHVEKKAIQYDLR